MKIIKISIVLLISTLWLTLMGCWVDLILIGDGEATPDDDIEEAFAVTNTYFYTETSIVIEFNDNIGEVESSDISLSKKEAFGDTSIDVEVSRQGKKLTLTLDSVANLGETYTITTNRELLNDTSSETIATDTTWIVVYKIVPLKVNGNIIDEKVTIYEQAKSADGSSANILMLNTPPRNIVSANSMSPALFSISSTETNGQTQIVMTPLASGEGYLVILANGTLVRILIDVKMGETFRIVNSIPAEGSEGVKVFNDIILTFSEEVEIIPNTTLSLRPQNFNPNTHFSLEISSNDLKVEGTKVTIPFTLFFNTENPYAASQRMYFEKATELVGDGAIKGKVSKLSTYGSIINFTTQKIPEWGHIVKATSTFTKDTINWNSLSARRQNAIEYAHTIHNLDSAKNLSLTGKDVQVGILDTGIGKTSEVYSAVVYRSVNLNSDLFLHDYRVKDESDTTIHYNHGTQMARYMLDYAPGINILDFNKNWGYLDELGGVLDIVKLIETKNPNILSLSGSFFNETNYTQEGSHFYRLHSLIKEGLVVSRALGNQSDITNTPSSNRAGSKSIFLPYFYDLEEAKGAWVTLQAITGIAGAYQSLRSEAGHAQYYTLSIIETGKGATSQATATFSGILSLMIEANIKNSINRTPQELVEILMETAIDMGDPGVDKIYGHGLVDISAALTFLNAGKSPSFNLYETLDANGWPTE